MHGAGAGGAGAAEGEVAAAQRLTGVDVGGQGRDTGGGGEPEGAVGGGERADVGDQAAGEDLGVGDAAVDHHDEIAVLAAGQPVLPAQGAGQAGGQRAEDGGLGLGGQDAVVEAADADQGEGVAVAPGGPLHLTEPADQRRAVRQPGDRVGQGELEQFGVGAGCRRAGGDVAAVQDERADVGVVAQVADGGLDQPPSAVGGAHPGGAHGELAARVPRAVEGAEQGGGVVGVDDLGERQAERAGLVEPEQAEHDRRGEGDAERVVEDDDGVDAALHERAERGLAAPQVAAEAALPAPEHRQRDEQDGEAARGREEARHGAAGTAMTGTRTAVAATISAGTASSRARPHRGATGKAAPGCPRTRAVVTWELSGYRAASCSFVIDPSPERGNALRRKSNSLFRQLRIMMDRWLLAQHPATLRRWPTS